MRSKIKFIIGKVLMVVVILLMITLAAVGSILEFVLKVVEWVFDRLSKLNDYIGENLIYTHRD